MHVKDVYIPLNVRNVENQPTATMCQFDDAATVIEWKYKHDSEFDSFGLNERKLWLVGHHVEETTTFSTVTVSPLNSSH